jgi:hypothetical protein
MTCSFTTRLQPWRNMSDQEKEELVKRPAFDWILWLKWVLVTTLGWATGYVLSGLVTGLEFGVGLVLGIAQWIVLRSLVRQASWWIVASAVGWALGYMVATKVLPAVAVVLHGAVIGAIIGAMQWLVLRRWAQRAAWWIAISALGWAVGPILGASLVGAGVGAATGFALELLLRHARPEGTRGTIPREI